jgi:hypothetical protein
MRIGAGTARKFVFMLLIITYWNIFIVYIYYTNQIKREYLCQFINPFSLCKIARSSVILLLPLFMSI